jgi:hypothetical protein
MITGGKDEKFLTLYNNKKPVIRSAVINREHIVAGNTL